MAIEHNVITDPEIHEPKGISTAAANEMYVADGAGSGAWERTSISDHAEMAITNNATGTSTTAAGDPTLNTDADYTKITAGWASTHAEGITFNVDELVAAVDGDYRITFWAAIKVGANNNFVAVKYAIDDTAPFSSQKIVTRSTAANDYRNVFASGIVTLTAGQTISVYLASTITDTITVEEAGCQMWLVHEN